MPRWNRRGISKWHITIFLMAFQPSWEGRGLQGFINLWNLKDTSFLLGAGDNEMLLHLNQHPAKKRTEPFLFQGSQSLNFGLVLCSIWSPACGLWRKCPRNWVGRDFQDLTKPHVPPTGQFLPWTKCTEPEAPAGLIWGTHREKGTDLEPAARNPGLGNQFQEAFTQRAPWS